MQVLDPLSTAVPEAVMAYREKLACQLPFKVSMVWELVYRSVSSCPTNYSYSWAKTFFGLEDTCKP